jgi:hypothetical protein
MHAEDLKVGDWVTVLSWKPAGVFNMETGEAKTLTLRSFIGHPLKVLAIDLPFVAVEIAMMKACTSLDTRMVKLQRLSNKFVEALMPDEQKSGEKNVH